MEFASLLVKALLVLACCRFGQSQTFAAPTPQVGDLRLVNGSLPFPDTSGEVQIFFKDSKGKNPGWRSICGEVSETTANTICWQLGFIATESVKTIQNPKSTYWLKSVSCQNFEQHVLRCSWEKEDNLTCTSALYLECDPLRIYQVLGIRGYNGQVQLCGRDYNASSRGKLVVFDDQITGMAWGTVNNPDGLVFSREDADSACRQLGYTGSVPGSVQLATPIECTQVKKKWNQKFSSSCTNGVSHSCFGCCFAVNPSTDTCTGCSASNDIIIQCAYDIDYRNPPAAGNSSSCSYSPGSKPSGACVKQRDGGKYICAAENGLGTD